MQFHASFDKLPDVDSKWRLSGGPIVPAAFINVVLHVILDAVESLPKSEV